LADGKVTMCSVDGTALIWLLSLTRTECDWLLLVTWWLDSAPWLATVGTTVVSDTDDEDFRWLDAPVDEHGRLGVQPIVAAGDPFRYVKRIFILKNSIGFLFDPIYSGVQFSPLAV
jgi:hypothetical protein